jgi:predicted alpha/beta-hydrolase family hydrolase
MATSISPQPWTVALEAGASITALAYPSLATANGGPTLVLAHGAGADQRSAFMVQTAQALAVHGITVVTFNFPYKEQRRGLPDRRPVLESCYRAVVDAVSQNATTAGRPLFIGGKSMGGRIATQIAAADQRLPVAGLVALGYPLHPPGRPQQRRDEHLPAIGRPMLIVQGGRDAFGTPDEFGELLTRMNPVPLLHVVTGGDHSFKVSRASSAQQQLMFAVVIETVARWILRADQGARAWVAMT